VPGPAPLTVDVHILAATTADLERLVREGRIREDLSYRLSGMRLQLPPAARAAGRDSALVEHFIRKFAQKQKMTGLTLGDDALEYLLLYPWPGNLRQLANEVHRMVALADSDTAFTPAHLSPEILATRRTVLAADAEGAAVRIALDQPLPRAVEQLERVMIDAAPKKTTGGLEEAAKLLGTPAVVLARQARRSTSSSRKPLSGHELHVVRYWR
jgi:DNA-binding NtrC family response regulator